MMYRGKASTLALTWHGKVTATAGGEKVRSSFTLTATRIFPPSVAQEQKIILAVRGVLSILKGSTLHRRELQEAIRGRPLKQALPRSVAGPRPETRAVGGHVDE